jgi:glycylpeptide N-tetradecanoyltransferase
MHNELASTPSSAENDSPPHDCTAKPPPEPPCLASDDKKKKKKRRNRKKKKATTLNAHDNNGAVGSRPPPPPDGREDPAATSKDTNPEATGLSAAVSGTAVKNLKHEQLLDLFGIRRRNRGAESNDRPHKFWDTQPVPKHSAVIKNDGAIQEGKTPADIRDAPLPLPKGFEWCIIDVEKSEELQEVYTLLSENYVEDDDNMFRFDYSISFLEWALTPPNFVKEWHLGVRQSNNRRLRGFITGVPASVRCRDARLRVAEINFLCVHKKLRSKRLAPVLIKEVTRRINRRDVWQAVYTAGVVLPKPIGRCRYWHRSINPKKLIDVGFSRLAPRMNMSRTIRLYRLPEEPKITSIRKMEARDVPSACRLLNEYLRQFDIVIEFSEEEFAHWMLPRDKVLDSFVVEDPHSGEITDICSFYHLPSSIIGNDKYATLYAAYSFYNVATTVPLVELMNDCLVLAKRNKVDVFNALDIMENASFLEELKFGIGDGHLQYYLYNWRCRSMPPEKVGIVLL